MKKTKPKKNRNIKFQAKKQEFILKENFRHKINKGKFFRIFTLFKN